MGQRRRWRRWMTGNPSAKPMTMAALTPRSELGCATSVAARATLPTCAHRLTARATAPRVPSATSATAKATCASAAPTTSLLACASSVACMATLAGMPRDFSGGPMQGFGSFPRPGGSFGGPTERVCFKCHQPGHQVSSCPQGAGASTSACFKCGLEGHQARNCDVCFRCKNRGHLSSQCPNL
eukprot:m.21768 g.21768  ORF g.21768 m.21768 type:complete len:183 (+) comp8139_c0_seq1:304-852(+)